MVRSGKPGSLNGRHGSATDGAWEGCAPGARGPAPAERKQNVATAGGGGVVKSAVTGALSTANLRDSLETESQSTGVVSGP